MTQTPRKQNDRDPSPDVVSSPKPQLPRDSNNNSVPKQKNLAQDRTIRYKATSGEKIKRDQASYGKVEQQKSSLAKGFNNLPIRGKQIIALVASEIITIVGLAGGGIYFIIDGGRRQLASQAKSELAVTEANYQIKINQMGFGFRGQSDNDAIIRATQVWRRDGNLPSDFRAQIRGILRNEIEARNIEYATLVDTNRRIIVNANKNRTGEIFDPGGLVQEVLENPQQIKASAIVSRLELEAENPRLPEGFDLGDALIRYTVTPVRDPATQRVLGVLVSGDIVNGKLPIVQNTLEQFEGGYAAVYQRQGDDQLVLATSQVLEESENLTQAQTRIPLPDESLLSKAILAEGEKVTQRVQVGDETYTMAAQAVKNRDGRHVAVLIRGTPETQLNSLIERNITVTALIAGLAILADLFLAVILGRTIATPISKLRQTARNLAQGDLKARAQVESADEIGQLATAFNEMANKLEATIEDKEKQKNIQQREAQRAQLVIDVAAAQVDRAADAEALFSQALEEARVRLEVDRIVIYFFNPDWSGSVAVESVAPGWVTALNEQIEDACIPQELIDAYHSGRVVANDNVLTSGLHPDHLELMERLQVRANLIAPIRHNNELSGLLIAHHCRSVHKWQESEINFLKQLAVQLGNSLDRATFLEQLEGARQAAESLAEEQRQIKENLQKRALELLMEVDPVSQGDLTVRARVTADEVGTIADSYNATVESLRKIVTRVQSAAQNVAITTTQDEAAIASLSLGAQQQTKAIGSALEEIQAMAEATKMVAASAEQAEVAVRQAAQTVAAGDVAMNRTVEGIVAIRETVAGTAKKVKRLGESSQKISKVVNLISSFAAQTNLLALNASIEAARAGEEGRGFAVVAEEVRSLASQSAAATAEIEKIVAEIQAETNDVAAAMEAGTEQVVLGTKLVDETRQNLNQITEVSAKLNDLVESIAQATVQQSQTSDSVSQTITDVAAIANQTSTEADQVSTSFKQLLEVAQELQGIVGQFKVK